jgi:hypothetical protein
MNVNRVCVEKISMGREGQKRGYIRDEQDESIHHLYL